MIVDNFLKSELSLNLHPRKISIRKFKQGIDFLGYVVLPHHRVLRTKTKKRIIKKIKIKKVEFENKIISEESLNQVVQSYLGMLGHCCGKSIKERILRIIKTQ